METDETAAPSHRAMERRRRLELARAEAEKVINPEHIREDSRARTLAKRVQQRRLNQEANAVGSFGHSCTADTPRCPEARVMLLDTPECCRRHIRKIMAVLAGLLDREEIRWWADYGTLLGYLNFGGLIPWDKDGDLGILGEDRPKLLGLQEELLGLGFHATYQPVRPTQRFRTGDRMKVRLSQKNHTNIDVFIWHELPGGILDRTNYIGADLYKGREFPKDWVLPLERGEWDGINISVPAKPEMLAEWRYGANWREPLRIKHPYEARK